MRENICNQVPFQNCDRIKEQQCHFEPKQSCKDVPYQNCNNIVIEVCEEEYYEDCDYVPIQKCRVIHDVLPKQPIETKVVKNDDSVIFEKKESKEGKRLKEGTKNDHVIFNKA